MNDSKMQALWAQHETQLQQTRRLQLDLLREVKLDKARSTLRSLYFLPASTLAFFTYLAGYAAYFTAQNLQVWYFAFAGLLVTSVSVAFCWSSIRQLQRLVSLDYQAPIVQLQGDLSRLKTSVVTNLRIAAWVLPFGPFVGLFVAKSLLGIDLAELTNSAVLVSLGMVTLILEVGVMLILRAFRQKNLDRPWINWLLQGNGSQIDEAQRFLEQIEAFGDRKSEVGGRK